MDPSTALEICFSPREEFDKNRHRKKEDSMEEGERRMERDE